MSVTKYLRVKFGAGFLPGNHHGPDFSVKRWTWMLVRMGSYAKYWRLYVYTGSGRAYYLDAQFPHWLGEWPE